MGSQNLSQGSWWTIPQMLSSLLKEIPHVWEEKQVGEERQEGAHTVLCQAGWVWEQGRACDYMAQGG